MKIHSINNTYNPKNKGNSNINKSNSVSFGADKLNGLAGFYQSVADTGVFQKGVKSFSRSDKTFTHLLVIESCILSAFYMINTLRNKKIKKEQKPQMLINDTLTLGLSTAGAYLVEDKISAVVNKGAEKYFAKHKDFYSGLAEKGYEKAGTSPLKELLAKTAETAGKSGEELKTGLQETADLMGSHLKNIVSTDDTTKKAFQITQEKLGQVKSAVQDAIKTASNADSAMAKVKELAGDLYNSAGARAQADKILPGINKLKVLVIFGLIYRYIGPVLFTPIANKLSSKFFVDKKNTAKS